MGSLRKLFDLFEQKTQLMRLLEVSSRAEGVRIYIGGESLVVPYEELSVVSAPYEVDGKVVGTLGVIGPTRMAYEPHDPDRRHHVAAGQQRAQHEVASRRRGSSRTHCSDFAARVGSSVCSRIPTPCAAAT